MPQKESWNIWIRDTIEYTNIWKNIPLSIKDTKNVLKLIFDLFRNFLFRHSYFMYPKMASDI